MKTSACGAIGAILLLIAFSSIGEAQSAGRYEVQWETIVGSTLPATPSSPNAIGGIAAGTDPWSTLGGHAYVDLGNSVVDFEVKGLVFGNSYLVGTPGPVTQIKGTLICAPNAEPPLVIDTPPVSLSRQGDASFHGPFISSVAGCSATDVAFLIRNVNNNRWIAYGAVRVP
jgi:hypothetical protein